MKIRTQIQLLLSAILLLTASCSSCEQHNIKSAPDAYGAKLATQQATLGGGVVHGTALHALIKVAGTIQENLHEEQTLAGIIVIPQGADIQTAAEELRDTAHPQEVNTYTALLGGQGFAYYDSHVAEKQQGAVTITAWSETIPLQGNTTYEAYCILRRTQTGCVYYSPAGMSFTTPDLTTFPRIQMQRADATKNATGTIQLDLASDIVTLGTAAIKKQGFLLTKQGGTNVEPHALVASLLRENKPLPTAAGLQPWDSNPDAIHVGGTISAAVIEALNILDTSSLLQRGATYDVCSYAVCEDHGQDYYIFSHNTMPATILKTVVDLQMDTASILKLVNTADPHLVTLTLEFRGSIVRQEYTKNPIIGFLATKTSDKDIAEGIVSRLLPSLSPGSSHHKDPAHDDIIFNVGPATSPFSQQYDVSTLLPAMKGQDYHVYCWLEDSGEVFMSDHKELKVPQVTVSVTRVTSTINPATPLLIDIDTDIKYPKNLSTNPRKGLLFVKVGGSLNQAMLDSISRQANAGDGETTSQFSSGDVVFHRRARGETASTWVFDDNAYGHFAQHTQYHVYAWLQSDNALFVSGAATDTLQTRGPYATILPVNSFDAGRGTADYTVDLVNHTVRWIKTGGGTGTGGDLKKATNDPEIKVVLGQLFKKNNAPDMTAINDFIRNMRP